MTNIDKEIENKILQWANALWCLGNDDKRPDFKVPVDEIKSLIRQAQLDVLEKIEPIIHALDAQAGNREMNLQDCDMLDQAHKAYRDLKTRIGE